MSDFWKPQFHYANAAFPVLSHPQVRNLQGLSERCPRLPWASAMQRLFRTAMHLAKRRTRLTERGFARQVQRLERRLDVLLLKEPRRKLVSALFRRFVTHRDKLLLFLHDPARAVSQ